MWPSYLGLVRLPANHVEDVEGGGDGAVLTAVHLCQHRHSDGLREEELQSSTPSGGTVYSNNHNCNNKKKKLDYFFPLRGPKGLKHQTQQQTQCPRG